MKSIHLIFTLLVLPLAAQTVNSHGLKVSPVQSAQLLTFSQPGIGPADTPLALSVQFETWVEQLPRDNYEGVYASFAGVEEKAGKATIGRLLRDHFRKVQVAYLLTLERAPGGQGYQLGFEDLPQAEGTPAAIPPGWTSVAAAARPGPQFVLNGDVIKMDLYDRPLGTKLVEYIRIGAPGLKELREGAPRDAYAEDAEFSIVNPKFRANGLAVPSAPVADFHGPLLRVWVPKFGGYILSLKQHADLGFENAGEVSGSALTFLIHGNLFRIDCTDRIAPGSAAYNVYAAAEDSGAASGTVATIAAEAELKPSSPK